MSTKDAPKESKVERAKRGGKFLRGSIAERLQADDANFEHDDAQLLKFHGIYQQDDRDDRQDRRADGLGKAFQFMVRLSLPGGMLNAEQYLSLDRLADTHANRSLRITTRQGFQLHGVLKSHLKPTLAAINDQLMTTLSACGDVERNVMCCPAPLSDPAYQLIRKTAKEIAERLRPASRAYHEIWLDGDKVVSTEEEEPFYGKFYLPRKFKTGITLAGDSSIDLYSYDCGLLGFVEEGRLVGYNLLVGGGMGMTHNQGHTFAALAQPLGFVAPEHAVEAVRTVATIFRDNGNRADRRHARLKYLLDQWGLDRFREEFRKQTDFELRPPRPEPQPHLDDFLGRREQDNGLLFYGIFVENGRIKDQPGRLLKSVLRKIIQKHRPGIRLTAQQSLLLVDLKPEQIDDIEVTLKAHGVPLVEELSGARRHSLACPALPTCGLALAESERLMPSIIDEFESEFENLGLRDEPLTIRMTGCPNGCARPYTADIAFVGRKPGIYHIYVGGRMAGDRVADLYAQDIPQDQLLPILRPLLEQYAHKRSNGQSLGDYYQQRIGHKQPRTRITGKETPTINLIQLGVPA